MRSKQLVTSPSFDERRAGSVDGTGRRLIAAWKTRLQERAGPDKNLPMPPWYDDRKVGVIFRDAQVLSLKLDEKLFAGGAHELTTVLYESYSLDRVDRLSMADLFVEGSARKLNELGEKKFREQRGIAPGRSLADAGFDFPGGIFRLLRQLRGGRRRRRLPLQPLRRRPLRPRRHRRPAHERRDHATWCGPEARSAAALTRPPDRLPPSRPPPAAKPAAEPPAAEEPASTEGG